MIQIGELADRAGLSLRTVRYYEEAGLITPESRTEGGFRLYTDDHVDRLTLIKQMKPLGFSLSEMRDLLEARGKLRSPRAGQKARTAATERLAAFADRASERCEKLRAELDAAEGLAAELRRETSRAEAPTRP